MNFFLGLVGMSYFIVRPPRPRNHPLDFRKVSNLVRLRTIVFAKIDSSFGEELLILCFDHAPASARGRLVDNACWSCNLVHLIRPVALRRHRNSPPATFWIVVRILI